MTLVLGSCGQRRALEVAEPTETTVEQPVTPAVSQEITERLAGIEGLSFSEIPNDHEGSHISKTFELLVTQPVDHTDPAKGTFEQKVYLSHASTRAPMVMYLNGYTAGSNRYLTEPARQFKANQIHVEHRYFADSKPTTGVDWSTLTIEQSAADHHRIVELLKTIYTGPWLNTGISKGGQTTMYHRRYYPEDVDASLVYVAPLNLDLMDERLDLFLDTVGGDACQNKVRAYQMELLMNYDQSLREFVQLSEERGYEYKAEMDAAFELSVLEYGFAFFQWSGDCALVPDSKSSIGEKVAHLFTIDAPGFFTRSAIDDLYPFFHQSYTQMGMYGYRVDHLGGLTRVYKENFSNYRTFIDESIDLTYDPTTHRGVKSWLDANGDEMIYIVGEVDPWSATSYTPTTTTDAKKYVITNGSHSSRVADLPLGEQKEVWEKLSRWMGE